MYCSLIIVDIYSKRNQAIKEKSLLFFTWPSEKCAFNVSDEITNWLKTYNNIKNATIIITKITILYFISWGLFLFCDVACFCCCRLGDCVGAFFSNSSFLFLDEGQDRQAYR